MCPNHVIVGLLFPISIIIMKIKKLKIYIYIVLDIIMSPLFFSISMQVWVTVKLICPEPHILSKILYNENNIKRALKDKMVTSWESSFFWSYTNNLFFPMPHHTFYAYKLQKSLKLTTTTTTTTCILITSKNLFSLD